MGDVDISSISRGGQHIVNMDLQYEPSKVLNTPNPVDCITEMYTIKYTLYTVSYKLYAVQCKMYTVN